MITTERGVSYCGGAVTGLNVPKREFECKSPAEVREMLPSGKDIAAFQCRNPIHKAHYELFTRALEDKLLRPGAQVGGVHILTQYIPLLNISHVYPRTPPPHTRKNTR